MTQKWDFEEFLESTTIRLWHTLKGWNPSSFSPQLPQRRRASSRLHERVVSEKTMPNLEGTCPVSAGSHSAAPADPGPAEVSSVP